MTTPHILIVDDEEGMLEVCSDTLRMIDDVALSAVQDSREAARRLETERFDLLITDLLMPHVSGVELVRMARAADPSMPAVVLTAFPTVDTAVETMKLGAVDYIIKPFKPEELRNVVRRLLEDRRLREENRLLQRHIERAYKFDEFIGESAPMKRIFELVERVAETDADVLILGETGTGKELVARAIHKCSKRSGGRFVPLDCGAIPDNLMESELFGHERGAFTGAHERSLGLLEFASGGTFFLDEVADLPPLLQNKLLRALQERKIRRLGGTHELDIDVRILAATRRDLEADIRDGRFREDLYYRINVARIELPALRERGGDIALLTRHFIGRFSEQMSRAGVRLEPEVLDIFARHPWPGNVRQLQNVVQRVLAMTRGDTLSVDDLPDEVVVASADRRGTSGGGFFARRGNFEVEYFTELVRRHSGDVNEAAREAELPRGTLYRLLKKHGIEPARFRS